VLECSFQVESLGGNLRCRYRDAVLKGCRCGECKSLIYF
jgi:hypothetical protein